MTAVVRLRTPALVWLAFLVVLSGCQRKVELTPAARDAWAAVIAAHTSGVVSRSSSLRVRFVTDALPEGGNVDAAQLTIEPGVAGKLRANGARELEFVPDGRWRPGQHYTVELRARGLRGIPQDLAPYRFGFGAQSPQFDVALGDLQSDPADDQRMLLRGTLNTADSELPEQVERVLGFSYRGQARQAVWTHSTDGLTHSFTVGDLQRQPQSVALGISADGTAIGADKRERYEVAVPAADQFIVTNAEAVEEEGRRQIRVSFSDSLDEKQNLRGLIELSAGEFTLRVDDNQLLIYPKADVSGEVTVTLDAGLRNARGRSLGTRAARTLLFTSEKPQLRFVGEGVILPDGKSLRVPFEAVSARSVHVVATRVYPENVAQFLQVNKLGGDQELGRVGRYLWRKTLPLGGPITGGWTRFDLDVTELMKQYPGSLFQLSLQLTPTDSAYQCANAGDAATGKPAERPLIDQEDGDRVMPSSWDFAEDYFGVAEDEEGNVTAGRRWQDRDDPCKAAYFTYQQATHATRNILASNLGLLAKRDQNGKWLVTVTDLRNAGTRSGVKLSLRNYQYQELAQAVSDSNGMATLTPNGTPFLLVADSAGQRGYLKLNDGNALPTSQFDVGGAAVTRGLRGTIYGERGVWRPGDVIHLTLVVRDPERKLPADHPATLELRDPRGRVASTAVNAKPVDGFYRFDVSTAPDAPTGDWTAAISLGGTTFNKTLKVETVMPNRLKIDLDLGKAALVAGQPIAGRLNSQWLTGATAAGLKADIKLRLVSAATHFNRFTDYTFDDPAREFKAEPQDVFEGQLSAAGTADFSKRLDLDADAPGMLSATFSTRVFEPGGAFSINRITTAYAPYRRFVGLRLPKGDVARGILQTDQDHVVEIGSLSAAGVPVAVPRLKVSLYKVEWRWWWDKTQDSLAHYLSTQHNALVREESLATDAKGQTQWKLRINYPEWGRYLLRVCDTEGGHCAGSTFYIDWPSWAGKQREQSGPAASLLTLTADKPGYQVGEVATVQLPESAQGRALVTVENGSGILDARWLLPRPGNNRFTVPITAAMTPNAYVAVTLVQPHEGKSNDRPIRLYGVLPLEVTDPATHIRPLIKSADEWRPSATQTVAVSEAGGHPMTYTLAVVDEGLLSLTNFKTPDLHGALYQREALGVKTWDLYDDVIGAYGGELERLLALGGSDSSGKPAEEQSQSRFPPVVQVLGPFRLGARETQQQTVTLPRYVGAVRVMVVAGDQGGATAAYGLAEKSVYVRQPLMILPTLPRVVGPNEEIAVPVSVFAGNATVKDVSLSIKPDAMFTLVGDGMTRVQFTQPAEKLALLQLRAGGALGLAHVHFTATSGAHRAEDDIAIQVRSSNPPTTRLTSKLLQPGESWDTTITPHGLAGTNKVTLEVSAVPPLNLDSRLRFLIQYPHGCLEQTTSAVFPQLFLSSLVKLEGARRREVEDNVRVGIERLRNFQLANGGFSYWPGGSGGFATGSLEGYALWATTYASHFLVEAEKAGYTIPASMRGGMIRHLRQAARDWQAAAAAAAAGESSHAHPDSSLDQAYRLYVLARAGQPEIGAMNRLRELRSLPALERWLLAASYQLGGLPDVARALTPTEVMAVRESKGPDYSLGSALRDHALVLQSLVMLHQLDQSQPLVRAISDELASDNWYSTQAVAYALLSMAELTGASHAGPFSFTRRVGGRSENIGAVAPIYQSELTGIAVSGTPLTLTNTSRGVLFATVSVRGTPAPEAEDASSAGLGLEVRYTDATGAPVDIAHLRQGADLTVSLRVSNQSGVAIDNIALTQIVPAGFEIRNERLEGEAGTGERETAPERNPFDGGAAATTPKPDYVDIRDDRVQQYFSLRAGASISFQTHVNAAYRGRFYLPGIVAEAMYDAGKQARSRGQWIEVTAK